MFGGTSGFSSTARIPLILSSRPFHPIPNPFPPSTSPSSPTPPIPSSNPLLTLFFFVFFFKSLREQMHIPDTPRTPPPPLLPETQTNPPLQICIEKKGSETEMERKGGGGVNWSGGRRDGVDAASCQVVAEQRSVGIQNKRCHFGPELFFTGRMVM